MFYHYFLVKYDNPLVSPSVPLINNTIVFMPNDSLFHDVTIILFDDEYGLEDSEIVTLYMSNPNMPNIDISSTANIEILDDDG